jgi:hypothetical protein
VSFGIPEYEAKQYEGKLKHGNILISVHTEDRKEREDAQQTLEWVDASNISYTGEARV